MEKVEEVKNAMAILVHPKEGINQIELNQFQEIPIGKKPKAKKVKIQRTQKKRISRKELKELGLYTLPKKKLLYNDYIPLNDLWNGYMLEQFGDNFKQLEEKFNFTHNQYEIMSGLLHKSDFHGAKIKVIQSKCPSMVGHKGIVIMETRDTLNIISKDNILRVIPKVTSLFEVKWKNLRFEIFGKHFKMKSAERSVKKLKSIKLAQL